MKTSPSQNPDVRRPGRYVGREWNLPLRKTDSTLRIVLCYPDVYEIGMSYPGLQILLHAMQSIPQVAVERVFSPWPDKEMEIRTKQAVLTTLETGKPVSSADVLCFSIPHELACTNILNILDLSGIPLRSHDRNTTHPFVFGGGIVTMNPIPLAPFFDGFFIGEVEDQLPEIVRTFKENPRHQFAEKLSQIPGVYIPSSTPSNNSVVIRQFVRDLDSAPLPDPPLVPWCRPVHERVVVEASRGCPRSCRFCQARAYYQPVRARSDNVIRESAEKQLQQTGYEELSLLSLNIADHPGIENLLADLIRLTGDKNVSISLPSLRPEKLTPAIIDMIKNVRKTGFTLAPEAGTERLRNIIGKPFSTNKLLETAATIFQSGWHLLKLYFMIGLPYETDDDVHAINHLVRAILKIGRRIAGGKASVHVSAATFIPKPHTPFQWCGQADAADILRRQNILKEGCRIPGVKLSFSDFLPSRLEAFLSRGDSRACDIIEDAFKLGCRMDAWNDFFKSEIWQMVFDKHDVSLEAEATQHYSPGKTVPPWSFIDCGIPEKDLLRHYEKAAQAAQEPPVLSAFSTFLSSDYSKKTITRPSPQSQEPIYAYAAIFQVLSDFRLFTHLETVQGIVRAMRRAGLPLVYSKGFNPRPKITWPKPAPFGFERWSDPLIFYLSEPTTETEILDRLNRQLPPEYAFLKICDPRNVKRILQNDITVYALRTGSSLEKLMEYFKPDSTLTMLETAQLGTKTDDRLREFDMNFVFALNGSDNKGSTLKDILFKCFGSTEIPLFPVSGARVGWLSSKLDDKIIYGMEVSD